MFRAALSALTVCGMSLTDLWRNNPPADIDAAIASGTDEVLRDLASSSVLTSDQIFKVFSAGSALVRLTAAGNPAFSTAGRSAAALAEDELEVLLRLAQRPLPEEVVAALALTEVGALALSQEPGARSLRGLPDQHAALLHELRRRGLATNLAGVLGWLPLAVRDLISPEWVFSAFDEVGATKGQIDGVLHSNYDWEDLWVYAAAHRKDDAVSAAVSIVGLGWIVPNMPGFASFCADNGIADNKASAVSLGGFVPSRSSIRSASSFSDEFLGQGCDFIAKNIRDVNSRDGKAFRSKQWLRGFAENENIGGQWIVSNLTSRLGFPGVFAMAAEEVLPKVCDSPEALRVFLIQLAALPSDLAPTARVLCSEIERVAVTSPQLAADLWRVFMEASLPWSNAKEQRTSAPGAVLASHCSYLWPGAVNVALLSAASWPSHPAARLLADGVYGFSAREMPYFRLIFDGYSGSVDSLLAQVREVTAAPTPPSAQQEPPKPASQPAVSPSVSF